MIDFVPVETMSIPYIILTLGYMAAAVALMVIILLQKKRSAGLGSIAGMGSSQTYWDKNKGRSMEGVLEKYTKIGGAVLFVYSLLMCVIK
jgi:preprotein translocase subunit SecG